MKKFLPLLLLMPVICFWSCGNGNKEKSLSMGNDTTINIGNGVVVGVGAKVLGDKKRYFFISYLAADNRGNSSYGNFYTISDTLPSYEELEKLAYGMAKGTAVAFKWFSVIGVYEFKDSTEYDNFKPKN